jgi:hypothetical protein
MTEFNLDMTVMFAIHDALRRDLAEFERSRERTEGWRIFEQMLHTHHTIEDDLLWPVVRGEVRGQPDALALLDQMAAEHAALNPALDALDQELERGAPAPQAVTDLEARLVEHLTHEEHDALPLIDRTLSQEQWMAFGQGSAQRMGPFMDVYLPWLLEGVDDATTNHLLAVIPPPVRQTYLDQWLPAFSGSDRWSTKVAVGER